MSYVFEGHSYRSLADWKRAFPAYRAYDDLLRSGADTVQKLEVAIAERTRRHRVTTLAGAHRSKQINPPPSFAGKRKRA